MLRGPHLSASQAAKVVPERNTTECGGMFQVKANLNTLVILFSLMVISIVDKNVYGRYQLFINVSCVT